MKRWRSFYACVELCGLIGGAFIASADPLDVWHWRNPLPQANALRSVTYANGTIVAVGDGGMILRSADGDSWTIQTSDSFAELDSVSYGNGVFVTVGKHGTILTSDDGAIWTSRESTTTNDLYSVAFGNGVFLAGGIRGYMLGLDEWGGMDETGSGSKWIVRWLF